MQQPLVELGIKSKKIDKLNYLLLLMNENLRRIRQFIPRSRFPGFIFSKMWTISHITRFTLELTYLEFVKSLLCKFCFLLSEYNFTNKFLDLMLVSFQQQNFIKHRGKEPTNSTQLFTAIRQLNMNKVGGQTLPIAATFLPLLIVLSPCFYFPDIFCL